MKNNTVLAVLSVTLGLFIVSDRVLGHHSESINDQTRLVTVTGTVTKFAFTNPHEQIYLDVKGEKGEVEQWIATGGGPSALRRVGWSNKTIEAGEQLTITGFPYKDGQKILFHLKIVRANGEALPLSEGERGRLERFLATHPNEQGK